MAERGRFELPIPVKVWLISSQFLRDSQDFALRRIVGEYPFYINQTVSRMICNVSR
jgi:hypothetical protein